MILYTSVNSVLKADRIGIENMFCFSSELEQPGGKSGSFNIVLLTIRPSGGSCFTTSRKPKGEDDSFTSRFLQSWLFNSAAEKNIV